MPPQSRGLQVPAGFQSKSTPNLPTLASLRRSKHVTTTDSDTGALAESPEIISSLESASREDDIADEDLQQSPSGIALDQDEDFSSDAEDADTTAPRQRPLYTHASRSFSSLPPQTNSSMLFPPFYNRPPAPLPESPTLTSLFRPSFSAQASRPTTPESSDVELGDTAPSGAATPVSTTTTTADINTSARLAPPSVPRASPKVPTYEYYGFALYLASSAAFIMYLLWSYLPSPFLHQLGIHYYPNRWWALAVPSWLVVLIVYIYIALASYNTQYLTLPLSSCENLVDEAGAVACIDTRSRKIVKNGVVPAGSRKGSANAASSPVSPTVGRRGGDLRTMSNFGVQTTFIAGYDVDWRTLWSIGTDGVLDVPFGGVCEVLYGDYRSSDNDDIANDALNHTPTRMTENG
ncbi:PIG-P-domain-containing protein [Pseudovirgaria hyperparasitica]|uniref:PIG-P-domain-containing protein n=1 Tax=Pseudovirgaria hyperparasitica TaxID=470096 RepID=A0A6A6W4J8_9PEZI|nr:PIG-P-domain-containing protein [Pseudovirgaria hyperparasitica]KAF2755971.1 PIG-P-domain-containing protein [Pseudovirgaria hyperparasitica]